MRQSLDRARGASSMGSEAVTGPAASGARASALPPQAAATAEERFGGAGMAERSSIRT